MLHVDFLESFSLAYTIVLSRGFLIDVLPDEPSLATNSAHELAQLLWGKNWMTQKSFNDRMQIPDKKLLARLDVARDNKDESVADAKGIEFLKNSPYKDQLGQAVCFSGRARCRRPTPSPASSGRTWAMG